MQLLCVVCDVPQIRSTSLRVKQPKNYSRMWTRFGTASLFSSRVSMLLYLLRRRSEELCWKLPSDMKLHKAAFLQLQYSLPLPSRNLPPTQSLDLAAAICMFPCSPCCEPVCLSAPHHLRPPPPTITPSEPLLSISPPKKVRYCISDRPFLTVSNAHQIPRAAGLRGLMSSNAFTYTAGLRGEITYKSFWLMVGVGGGGVGRGHIWASARVWLRPTHFFLPSSGPQIWSFPPLLPSDLIHLDLIYTLVGRVTFLSLIFSLVRCHRGRGGETAYGGPGPVRLGCGGYFQTHDWLGKTAGWWYFPFFAQLVFHGLTSPPLSPPGT